MEFDGTANIWWIEEAALDGEATVLIREGNRLAASFACGESMVEMLREYPNAADALPKLSKPLYTAAHRLCRPTRTSPQM